ncbi:MAG: hypothetical protein ACYDH8_14400 [Syntrophales bacterium]
MSEEADRRQRVLDALTKYAASNECKKRPKFCKQTTGKLKEFCDDKKV